MNDEQAANSNPNPDDPIIPNASTSEYVEEAETNQEHSGAKDKPCAYNDHPPIHVHAHIPKDNSYLAHGIQILAVLVNMFMVILTYRLLLETQETASSARASVVIADSALHDTRAIQAETRLRDLKQEKVDVIRDERSRLKDSLTIALASKSLDAQINSIKKVEEQFEIDNMPYLQFSNFNFTVLEANKPPTISYRISNLGKQPAKILSGRFGYFYNKNILVYPFRQIANLKSEDQLIGTYITKDYPINQSFPGDRALSRSVIDSIKIDTLSFIFFGEITYVNEVNKKQRIYKFNVKLRPPPAKEYFMIKNDNEDFE